MPSSLFDAGSAGANSPTATGTCAAVGDGRCAPTASVSAVRQAEDALDARIKAADARGVHLKAKGDEAGWRAAIREMHDLINSRSPEHQERLSREAWARMQRELDEGVDYFQVQGRLAREQADREATEGRIA